MFCCWSVTCHTTRWLRSLLDSVAGLEPSSTTSAGWSVSVSPEKKGLVSLVQGRLTRRKEVSDELLEL